MNIEFIFVYTRFYLPLFYYIFAIYIFRMILNIASNSYLKRNDYNIVANSLLISGLICGLIFLSLPTYALNGIELIQMWSSILALIILIGFGVAVYIIGYYKLEKYPRLKLILERNKIKTGIIGGVLIFIILIPLIVSVGPIFTLSNTSVYTTYEWNKRIQREIMWTRTCAGLDMFEERPINNFTTSATSKRGLVGNDSIRVYDQNYAVQYLAAEIGSTYEGLADSDIIYFNNTEYWCYAECRSLVLFNTKAILLDDYHNNTKIYTLYNQLTVS